MLLVASVSSREIARPWCALAPWVVAVGLTTSCVSKTEHERLLDEAGQRLTAEQTRHQREVDAAVARGTKVQAELDREKGKVTTLEAQTAELSTKLAGQQKRLDDATALNEQLRSTLERAGKSVDKLLAEKGTLAEALEDNKRRLEELRKAQLAAQKRAKLLEDLLRKFKRLVDAGDLRIIQRDGRLVLQLRNDVLFDSGKVALKKEGEDALAEVAKILITIEDRNWQVAGHTDNVPISTGRFPSNWELSTARAVTVVKFLEDKGVRATSLSAAGYGEHDPVAKNTSADNKAKNRRIEIVLQPDLSELVQVPLP